MVTVNVSFIPPKRQ